MNFFSKFKSKYLTLNSLFFFPVKRKKAFTLAELLITIGITTTISLIGIGFYVNQQKMKVLDTTAQEIVNYLKYAKQKSIAQEQGLQWGVHFENPTSGNDFYALYTGTTYSSPVEIQYLPTGIIFATPTPGTSINISFNKLTGTNYNGTNQTIVIQSINLNVTKTVSVSSQGLVTY